MYVNKPLSGFIVFAEHFSTTAKTQVLNRHGLMIISSFCTIQQIRKKTIIWLQQKKKVKTQSHCEPVALLCK